MKRAGAGFAGAAALLAVWGIWSLGRCGRLRRRYEAVVASGGPDSFEASSARLAGGSCRWAEELESSREQDRYARYYARMYRV